MHFNVSCDAHIIGVMEHERPFQLAAAPLIDSLRCLPQGNWVIDYGSAVRPLLVAARNLSQLLLMAGKHETRTTTYLRKSLDVALGSLILSGYPGWRSGDCGCGWFRTALEAASAVGFSTTTK